MPNLICQPIVENAFEHWGSGPAKVTSVIAARREGIPDHRRAGQWARLGDAESRAGSDEANTEARLEQLYGEAGKVSIRDAEGAGGGEIRHAVSHLAGFEDVWSLSTKTVRVLIADDELLARQRIGDLLQKERTWSLPARLGRQADR